MKYQLNSTLTDFNIFIDMKEDKKRKKKDGK